MEPLIIGMVFLGIPTILAWTVKNYYAHQRFMKILQLKAEMNARLLDRLGTEPGVLEVLKSDVQQKAFEISLPELESRMPAFQARVLTGAQAGLVLGSLGAGLLMIRPQFMGTGGDAPEVLLVFGAIAVSLGVGAVLASVAAFAASKVWQNEAA